MKLVSRQRETLHNDDMIVKTIGLLSLHALKWNMVKIIKANIGILIHQKVLPQGPQNKTGDKWGKVFKNPKREQRFSLPGARRYFFVIGGI